MKAGRYAAAPKLIVGQHLAEKTQLTRQEGDSFKAADLRKNHYVQVGKAYCPPGVQIFPTTHR